MKFEEKSLVQYKDYVGYVRVVCKNYFTFTPLNTNILMLIYPEEWQNVTVRELAQSP
mgnify:CR=1 FL=1